MSKILLPVFLWLSAIIVPSLAVPRLKQIHVVTRHGARTPLPKNGTTLTELAGPSLTPIGQHQLYEVGTWLQQVYNTTGMFSVYDPLRVRLESSSLDRTLSSANALSLGVYPMATLAGGHGEALFDSLLPEMTSIPVYTMADSNDIYLRAYHKNCPAFQDRLEDLYQSTRWRTIEANHGPTLETMANVFPEASESNSDAESTIVKDGKMVLTELWTYYDMINVARTECLPDPTIFGCVSLGPDVYELVDRLTDEEFRQVEELMAMTEGLKFGPDTAGNLLGSQLLWRMLNRIDEDATFFLYSAHAPTMLSLLSTLQEAVRVESYPDYGSAIIMEVYHDATTNVNSIRFVYKVGELQTARYVPIQDANCEETFNGATPLSTGVSGDDVKHCNLAKFTEWATTSTLVTVEDWCDACQNVKADVCLQYELSKMQLGRNSATNDETANGVVIAGTFFGGLLAGWLILGIGGFYTHRRKQATATASISHGEEKSSPMAETDAPEINIDLD
jgi:hypothetical protein